MSDAEAPGAAGAAPPASAPEASPPSADSSWGRRFARGYLVVCTLALAWMGVETALHAPGGGTILSAILTLPWSLLVAQALPAIPPAWSFAARVALLVALMGLNALVLRGMAARFQRDLRPKRG